MSLQPFAVLSIKPTGETSVFPVLAATREEATASVAQALASQGDIGTSDLALVFSKNELEQILSQLSDHEQVSRSTPTPKGFS